MKIAGYQKMSFVDFPQLIATVIFTAGCNLACPYCHNAALNQAASPLLDPDMIFSYLEKRKCLIDGVVISGGEPTLQADLIPFVRQIRALGYRVKLDTNGFNPHVIEALVKENLIDYFALDYKMPRSAYAWVNPHNLDVSALLTTLTILKSSGVDYEIRITFASNQLSEAQINELALELRGVKMVYLQPFRLTPLVPDQNLRAPSAKEGENLQKALTAAGINAQIRAWLTPNLRNNFRD